MRKSLGKFCLFARLRAVSRFGQADEVDEQDGGMRKIGGDFSIDGAFDQQRKDRGGEVACHRLNGVEQVGDLREYFILIVGQQDRARHAPSHRGDFIFPQFAFGQVILHQIIAGLSIFNAKLFRNPFVCLLR